MSEEEKPRLRGFQDPDVRRKAIQKSIEVRRGGEDLEAGLVDFANQDLQAKGFLPTKAMLMVLKAALSEDVGFTQKKWFEAAGLSRSNWNSWIKQPGFLEWWNLALQKGCAQFYSTWMLIGIKKMGEDHKHWEAMGDRFFNFQKKMVVTTEQSQGEKELTDELIKYFRSENQKKDEKVITVQSEEETVLTEADIKQMNEEREVN